MGGEGTRAHRSFINFTIAHTWGPRHQVRAKLLASLLSMHRAVRTAILRLYATTKGLARLPEFTSDTARSEKANVFSPHLAERCKEKTSVSAHRP